MRRMVAIFPKRESITDHPALTPIIAKAECSMRFRVPQNPPQKTHSRISGLHFPGEKAIMLKAASVKRENTKNCLLLFKNPRIKMT